MKMKELAEWLADGPDREIRLSHDGERRVIHAVMRDGNCTIDRRVSLIAIDRSAIDILGFQVDEMIGALQRH